MASMARKKAEPEANDTTELPEPTPLPVGLPRRRKKTTPAEPSATPDEESLALARRIVDLASDKKASDIVLLEIGGLTTLADYFVIASGQSDRQLGAIVDGIVD